jgi:hypothetical protein
MDPLMRKLFQPREAREKLRGMGGIMSSSPQLASTVAKFQQGGPIQTMAPERSDLGGAMPLASAIHGPSGMMYGQMSLQQLSELANSGDRLAAEVLMMLQPPTGGTLPDETRARLDLVRDITDPDSSFGRQLDQFSARLADFGTQPRVAADLAGMDAPSIDAVPTIALDTAPAAPRQAPRAVPQGAADTVLSVTPSFLSLTPSLGMPSAPDAPLPSAGRARATRVGDRTFVLTDDGRVLDAQTGAPATPEVEAEVRSRLSPQLSMMDIVGAEPEYGMGGVNPSFAEDTSGQLPPMPSDLAPMTVPAMPADPGAPFDMAAFQRDLIGAGRAVAGPGLMAIGELPYDGPLTLGFDTAALSGAFGGSPDGQASLTDQYRQIMDELRTPGISENRRRALNTQLDTISLALKAARADDRIMSAGGRAGAFITDMAGNVVSAFNVDAGEGVFDFGDRLREYSATTPKDAASIVEQLALESAHEAAAQRDAQGLTTSLSTAEDVANAAENAAQTVTRTSVAGVEPTTETPTAPVAVAVAETAAETPPAPTLDLDLNDPTTYDTDFDEMMKRLGGATGKDDKSSRQKAMADLAMIGLAIAAGQSPDALTNIAQGALTGMKAIRAEGAAKDAVAAETRALAAKLATDKEIARIRVPSGGGTYTPDRMLAQAVDSILAAPDFFDVFGADGKTVDMAKVAKKAKELVKNVASTRVVVQDGVRFQELPDGTYKELGS